MFALIRLRFSLSVTQKILACMRSAIIWTAPTITSHIVNVANLRFICNSSAALSPECCCVGGESPSLLPRRSCFAGSLLCFCGFCFLLSGFSAALFGGLWTFWRCLGL